MSKSHFSFDDPFTEAMHGYMRNAKISFAIAVIACLAAIAIRFLGSEHRGIYGPLIEQFQSFVSVGLMGITAICSFIAAFFLACIKYYQTWPARF